MGGQSFQCRYCDKWFTSGKARGDHEGHCILKLHERIIPKGEPMPEVTNERIEQHLINQIEEIRRRATAEAKPYVDKLIEMQSTRPAASLVIASDQIERAKRIGIMGQYGKFTDSLAAHGIGMHLATLNLFREPDGSVEITVADGKGAIIELDVRGKMGVTIPIDYIESLVIEAAANMKKRKG